MKNGPGVIIWLNRPKLIRFTFQSSLDFKDGGPGSFKVNKPANNIPCHVVSGQEDLDLRLIH